MERQAKVGAETVALANRLEITFRHSIPLVNAHHIDPLITILRSASIENVTEGGDVASKLMLPNKFPQFGYFLVNRPAQLYWI